MMATSETLVAELRQAEGIFKEDEAAFCAGDLFGRAADALSSQSLSLSEARALAEAQQNGNRFACSQWTKCELRLKEAEKDRARLLKQRHERATERDALVAAGEELVTALGRYGFPMSDEAWRNTGDEAPVNSRASVEARALHRAAAAYLRAISGGFDGGK